MDPARRSVHLDLDITSARRRLDDLAAAVAEDLAVGGSAEGRHERSVVRRLGPDQLAVRLEWYKVTISASVTLRAGATGTDVDVVVDPVRAAGHRLLRPVRRWFGLHVEEPLADELVRCFTDPASWDADRAAAIAAEDAGLPDLRLADLLALPMPAADPAIARTLDRRRLPFIAAGVIALLALAAVVVGVVLEARQETEIRQHGVEVDAIVQGMDEGDLRFRYRFDGEVVEGSYVDPDRTYRRGQHLTIRVPPGGGAEKLPGEVFMGAPGNDLQAGGGLVLLAVACWVPLLAWTWHGDRQRLSIAPLREWTVVRARPVVPHWYLAEIEREGRSHLVRIGGTGLGAPASVALALRPGGRIAVVGEPPLRSTAVTPERRVLAVIPSRFALRRAWWRWRLDRAGRRWGR